MYMYLVKSMICNAYTEAFPMTSNLILAPIIRPKNGLFAVAFLPQKSGSAQKMYYHFCYKKSFFLNIIWDTQLSFGFRILTFKSHPTLLVRFAIFE